MRSTRFTRVATAIGISVSVMAGMVAFAPNAFAATATVTPSTGLVDGQILAISGTGFTANSGIQILECSGTVASPPLDSGACDAFSLDTQAFSNGSGAFTNAVGDANGDSGYKVYKLGPTAAGHNSTILCDDTHACVLYIGVNFGNFALSHTFNDIAFAGPPHTPVAPVSPTPQGPLVVANLGAGNVTVNYGAAVDSAGSSETINPSSTIVTPATHGTATLVSPGVFHYSNTDGTQTTDSFVVGGATATCTATCSPTTSGAGNNVTVTVTILAVVTDPASCNVTTTPSCTLHQLIIIPVAGDALYMFQPSTPPITDVLNHTVVSGACTGPSVTLNGQPQNACGVMGPIKVINARGTDAAWSLTGQVSDFVDPAVSPTTTCSTPATYSNHCIPGGNLSWGPVAAVSHDIVPGDVAQVTGGPAVAPPSVLAAVLASSGALSGAKLQANPVVAPSPTGGLHTAAQTLCSAASTISGGTFECGANLVVAVPASAAAAAAPGFTGTLTLTLA